MLSQSFPNVIKIAVTFDFSQTLVDGIPLPGFIQMKDSEAMMSNRQPFSAYWAREVVPESYQAFFVEANNVLRQWGVPVYLTYSDAEFVCMVFVRSLDSQGNNQALYQTTRMFDNRLVLNTFINGEGGRFGSFCNLQCDGWKRAGREFAETVARNLVPFFS